ncbi:MAG: hypothetical protein H6922_02270 [Pseudomonadaceae bacterium]|nr:hypothetical protein [Pseudomonadaceae bacterium]
MKKYVLRGVAVLLVVLALPGMAALTGAAPAQLVFGAELHTFGLGRWAHYWYEKAAKQNHPGAMHVLAWYSLTGYWNFPQDDFEAWKWFFKGGVMAEGMAVDVSLLGYHHVLFEPGMMLDLARDMPAATVEEELDYVRMLSESGVLPFTLDEAGYRATLKN